MNPVLVAHPPNPSTLEHVDESKYPEVQSVVYVRAIQLNRLPDVVDYCGGIAVTISSCGASVTLPVQSPVAEMEEGPNGSRTPRTHGCNTFTALWDDISLMFPGTLYKGDGPTLIACPFEFLPGLHVLVHSADGTKDFGTALVRGSEENTALSYPRGDVQILFRTYHCVDGEIVYTRSCTRRKRTPPPPPTPEPEPEPEPEAEVAEEEGKEGGQDATDGAADGDGAENDGDGEAADEDLSDEDALARALKRIEVSEKKAQDAQAAAAAAEVEAAEADAQAATKEEEHDTVGNRIAAYRLAAAANHNAAGKEKDAADAESELNKAYLAAIDLGAEQEDFPEKAVAANERGDLALERMQQALDRAAAAEKKAEEAEAELDAMRAAAAAAEQASKDAEASSNAQADAAEQKQKDGDEGADAALGDAADALQDAANVHNESESANRDLAKQEVDGTDANRIADDAKKRADDATNRALQIRPQKEEAPVEEPPKQEKVPVEEPKKEEKPKEEPKKEEKTKDPTNPKDGLGESEEGGGCLC